MLDKPEVLAEVTEQPRFLSWEFDTLAIIGTSYKNKLNGKKDDAKSIWGSQCKLMSRSYKLF